MEKEFIPYEQALVLKKLRFDEPCVAIFDKNKELSIDDGFYKQENYHKATVLAPTFSQAFRWFREKHNVLANVYSNASGFLYEYHDTIGGTHRYDSGFTGDCEDSGTFTSFEKAQLACLNKLIEIVKQK